MYKIIFNNSLFPSINAVNAILIEVIGRRRFQAAAYLALDKKLISDIANIIKLFIIIVCTDTTNYYNKVAHSFISLYAQYFGVENIYLAILFRAIHFMKMFLQTVYGVSENYYSSNKGRLFQGVV